MPLESRPVAAQRILVNTTALLTSTKLDQYGEIANPGTTTVTVTRADDTVVATGAAATESAAYLLSYSLAASNNTQLDWLKAVWTDASDSTTWTTYHEVVGGFYASVAEIRLRDKNLLDAGVYPTDTIRALLWEVETAIESECGRSFVPRYGRTRMVGRDSGSLILPDVDIRSVRSVRSYSDYQNYTSFTASELGELDWSTSGVLTNRYYYWWAGEYVVDYEHGMDRPPPDVKAAAIRWLRNTLNASKSGIPDRATSFSVADGGSYSLITPGVNGAVSGIPDVDVVIARYKVPRFTVGV